MIAILAVVFLTFSKPGIELSLEGESARIDPGRSVFLDLVLTTSPGTEVLPPDLRTRFRGFSLAEDDEEEPVLLKDGRKRQVVHWRLVPEPCEKEYKLSPFVVGEYVAGPFYFEAPAAPEKATGPMELDPKKDLPPMSWRLARRLLCWALALAAALAAAFYALRFAARKVKEHRMSPIERAWVELDRLLKKGLPGRGRYKDFYVELTALVRRYVQRQHGVKAPHLTTEEFFEVARSSPSFPKNALDELVDFMRKADMVKFAGVEATPETADEATSSARAYIERDAAQAAKTAKETR